MKYSASFKKKIEGFTFVELSIVIAIVALFSSLALVGYTRQISKARDTQRKTDVNRIQKLVEEYEKDHSCYPQVGQWPGCGTAAGTLFENYIGTIPCDPQTDSEYVYDADSSACPAWFSVFADLENDNDFTAQQLGCANESCYPSDAVGSSQGFDFYVSSPNAPLPQGVVLPPTPSPLPATATSSPTATLSPTATQTPGSETIPPANSPTNTPTTTIVQETIPPNSQCPYISFGECDVACSEEGGRCTASGCELGTYQCEF